MIYEKRVSTLSGLTKELQTLDGDAGVRIEGTYDGKKCLVFITRFESTFTVIVSEAVGKHSSFPGVRLAARDFGSVEETANFIKTTAGSRVKAFVY